MRPPTLRNLLAGYAPVFAILAAIAAFVVSSPSVAPTPVVQGLGPATGDAGMASTGSEDTTAGGSTGATTNDGSVAVATPAPGTSASSGSASADQPGSAPTTGTGTTGSGAPTAPPTSGQPAASDCSRNEVFRAPTCRPAPFEGDNGGATYAGVTEDTVTVVVYIPKRDEQTTAILAAAGYASTEHRIDALEAYEEAFNRHFETYGRHVELVFQQGPNDPNDAQGQIADAQTAARDSGGFAVVTSSASEPFYDELARLGRPFFQRLDLYNADWFAARAPHAYTSSADSDVVLGHVAEYWCKRLDGQPAEHAGDATLAAQQRKLGIIYLDRFDWGPSLKAKIEACGGSVAGPVMSYTSDVSTANQQATAIASRMRSEGVTTVACACDAIAMTFFTQAATNQAWFPEWLLTGIGDTDKASNARTFDPAQARNAFGLSFSDYYVPVATRDYYRAYFEGKPDGDAEAAKRAGVAYYDQLLWIFAGIEAAGPNLTNQTFAQAVASLPPRRSPENLATGSFGPQGPGSYSAIDDLMEIWWDPNRTGPDGSAGWFHYVGAGQRYGLGSWPTSPPVVFVDDGSRQPGRDPDA